MPGVVEVERDGSAISDEAARGAADDEISRRATPGLPRIALALALAPLAVSAIALVVTVGGDYKPAGDIAIVEMTTRAVGEHGPLVGNHSRDG
jgi:hypothetical protein